MKKVIKVLVLCTVIFCTNLSGYGQDNNRSVGDLMTSKEWVLFKKASALGDSYDVSPEDRLVLRFFRDGGRLLGKCEDITNGNSRTNPIIFEWYLKVSSENETQLLIRNREGRKSLNRGNFIFGDFFKEKAFNVRIVTSKEGKMEYQLRFTPTNESKEIIYHYYFR